MVELQRLGQRWAGYKATKANLLWSCAACVVATIVVGFAWGGWVTGGSAKRMAEAAAAASRDTLVAAVCVDRFQAGGDAQAQLAALKLLQGYNRSSFIEKGGWAVMPDKSTASRAATSLCADQLVAL
jgi:GH24 family phage-related lysozyme (muramidase)